MPGPHRWAALLLAAAALLLQGTSCRLTNAGTSNDSSDGSGRMRMRVMGPPLEGSGHSGHEFLVAVMWEGVLACGGTLVAPNVSTR